MSYLVHYINFIQYKNAKVVKRLLMLKRVTLPFIISMLIYLYITESNTLHSLVNKDMF